MTHDQILALISLPVAILVFTGIWALARWALTQQQVQKSAALTTLFNIIEQSSLAIISTLKQLPVGADRDAIAKQLISSFIDGLQAHDSDLVKTAGASPQLLAAYMKGKIAQDPNARLTLATPDIIAKCTSPKGVPLK